jgi:alpha-glucosidase (family GH31 glycosyl hydrolase)
MLITQYGKYQRLFAGRQPTPPEFTLGYQHSKLRYYNQTQVMDVAQRFHDENVNVSLLVIGRAMHCLPEFMV